MQSLFSKLPFLPYSISIYVCYSFHLEEISSAKDDEYDESIGSSGAVKISWNSTTIPSEDIEFNLENSNIAAKLHETSFGRALQDVAPIGLNVKRNHISISFPMAVQPRTVWLSVEEVENGHVLFARAACKEQ